MTDTLIQRMDHLLSQENPDAPLFIYHETIKQWRDEVANMNPNGGSVPPVIRVPFAFDTPDLVLTGIPIYTPTAGEILAFASVSVSEAWDGTTPKLNYSTTGKPDVLQTQALDTANADYLGNGSIFQLPFAWTNFGGGDGFLLTAADLIVWVDDGAGGDPGSTHGAGEIVLVILAAA